MIRMDDKTRDFVKSVLFSNEVSENLKENALEILLDDETRGIKPFVIGDFPVTQYEFKKIKEAYENTDGNGPSKIRAIKVFREISGMGLKSSKDNVEDWINNNCEEVLNPVFRQ